MSGIRIKELSIVIPVYNGERTLGICLNGIFSQKNRPRRFEVVVVDDGSTDTSREIAKRYPVHLICLKNNLGRITARNIGAKATKYKYILFTDADCKPEITWISDLLNYNYFPIQGQVNNTSHTSVDRFFYLLRKKYYREIENRTFITKENFFRLPKGLANFLCSKAMYQKVQFYHKGEFFSDDQYLIYRMAIHKPVLAVSKGRVYHNERHTYRDLLIQWFQRGNRFADFYFQKDGILYKKFILTVTIIIVGILFLAISPLSIKFLISYCLLLLFMGYIVIVILLSENTKDYLLVAYYLPPIFVSFLLGAIHRKILL